MFPYGKQFFCLLLGDHIVASDGACKSMKSFSCTILINMCLLHCRSDLVGQLVHCDFCPLVFHMDCLNPPLTTVPSGMWMCPNHAEHAEVILVVYLLSIPYLIDYTVVYIKCLAFPMWYVFKGRVCL